jgi:hypothetical protein
MHRHSPLLFLGLALIAAPVLVAQTPMTKDQKIADAMKAAPASISAAATIMDWPAAQGGQMTTLRAGTNGWTCLPDFPGTQGDDPMCVDDVWMSFMNALTSKTPPQIAREGIGYMIAPGGAYGSNKDPFAEKETPTNEWGYDPPHVMLLVPDAHALQGLPTMRQSGGPWVMWSGTPYAHIMVPVESTKK